MARPPLIVSGKWFIPVVFIGFLLFTVAMSLGTVYLGKSMRPTLERMQVEREKAQMEREAKTGAAGSSTTGGATGGTKL